MAAVAPTPRAEEPGLSNKAVSKDFGKRNSVGNTAPLDENGNPALQPPSVGEEKTSEMGTGIEEKSIPSPSPPDEKMKDHSEEESPLEEAKTNDDDAKTRTRKAFDGIVKLISGGIRAVVDNGMDIAYSKARQSGRDSRFLNEQAKLLKVNTEDTLVDPNSSDDTNGAESELKEGMGTSRSGSKSSTKRSSSPASKLSPGVWVELSRGKFEGTTGKVEEVHRNAQGHFIEKYTEMDSRDSSRSPAQRNGGGGGVDGKGVEGRNAEREEWVYLVRLTNGRTVLRTCKFLSPLPEPPTPSARDGFAVNKTIKRNHRTLASPRNSSPHSKPSSFDRHETSLLLEATSSEVAAMKPRLRRGSAHARDKFYAYERFPSTRVWEGPAPRTALRSSAGQPILSTPLPTANRKPEARRKHREERRAIVSEGILVRGSETRREPFLPKNMTLPQVYPPPPPLPSKAPPPPPKEMGLFGKIFSVWGRRGSTKGLKGEEAEAQRKRIESTEKAVMALGTALTAHKKTIDELQKEKSKVKVEMERDIRRWERYAIHDLEVLGQRTMAMRLINIRASQHMELEYYHELLNIMAQLQAWKNRMCDEFLRPKGFDLEALLKGIESGTSIDELIDFPGKMQKHQEAQKLMNESDTLTKEYKEAVTRLAVKETFSQRNKRLMEVIHLGDEEAEWDDVYERYWRQDTQETRKLFQSLFLDERQSEGQLIRRWRALLHRAGSSNVSADAVSAFFEHMRDQTCARYSIATPREKAALDLLLARLIYPLIGSVVNDLREDREMLLDTKFSNKAKLLRSVSPLALELKPHHLPPSPDNTADTLTAVTITTPCNNSTSTMDGAKETDTNPNPIPYASAAATLAGMSQSFVPADMVQAALETIRQIYTTATDYYKANHRGQDISDQKAKDSVHADALFPIVVYVLLHSQIDDIHYCLGTIERFIDDKFLSRGESGISLSIIRAAAAHITAVDVTRFGFKPQSEENEGKEREGDKSDTESASPDGGADGGSGFDLTPRNSDGGNADTDRTTNNGATNANTGSDRSSGGAHSTCSSGRARRTCWEEKGGGGNQSVEQSTETRALGSPNNTISPLVLALPPPNISNNTSPSGSSQGKGGITPAGSWASPNPPTSSPFKKENMRVFSENLQHRRRPRQGSDDGQGGGGKRRVPNNRWISRTFDGTMSSGMELRRGEVQIRAEDVDKLVEHGRALNKLKRVQRAMNEFSR